MVMARRRRRTLSGSVLLALLVSVAWAGAGASAVTAGGPTRSTSSNLAQKRYVAAGDRAYVIGSQDGMFPPMGWHIRGEMGGVWAHPIKLLDAYWLALNGRHPTASRFSSGAGYTRMEFPATQGIEMTRTEFSPDGSPVVLAGVDLENTTTKARRFTLTMDVRSEIMASYPWGWTTPNARDFNGPDAGAYDNATGTLTFRETGKPWFAKVGTSIAPTSGATGGDFWGPVPGDDRAGYTENGNGTGGRMQWVLNLSPGQERTLWIAVAGSHTGEAAAASALAQGLSNPQALLANKISQRLEILARSDVDLPDAVLEDAFDWGKLNMQDLKRTATDLRIRDVDEGRQYPPPVGTLARATGIGAGYPDYPWYFGTDGAYTAYPLVASGQWDLAKDHLRTIKDVSRMVNGATGKVVHEVMTEGSVYWGALDDAGNTNETAQFATAAHVIWRWSGDNAFRDEMYGFVRDGVRFITSKCGYPTCDNDEDLWPEGNGMVERTGMGSEKLDVTAYTWQALRALQDMAASKGDAATASWADARADAMEERFDPTWWMPQHNLYADSLCNPGDLGDAGTNVCTEADQQLQQKHWINATPMEVVLADHGLAASTGDGGLAPNDHANAALDTLETGDFTGQCGLFHTGVGGGPTGAGELKCWTLPSSVMAVAEANYGRLNSDQAPFYMRTIAEQLDLEMPGALPEIVPSPEYAPLVDFRERAMFMQAWSSYGVQWPVIDHFLGIRPDVPDGRLYVAPDVPEGWPGLSIANLRVGSSTMSAAAARDSGTYTTEVDSPTSLALTIGHTLPAGATVGSVTLDGSPAHYDVVDTTRGREVRVDTTGGTHRLVVTTGSAARKK